MFFKSRESKRMVCTQAYHREQHRRRELPAREQGASSRAAPGGEQSLAVVGVAVAQQLRGALGWACLFSATWGAGSGGMAIAMTSGMKTRPIAHVHPAMKTTSFPLLLALAIFSQGCIVVDDPGPDPAPPSYPSPVPPPADGLLRIDNDSSFVFYDIYVTPIDAFSWGPDLLGSDVLFPDESLTIEVGCDYYDAMVVDEYGNECVIESLDLCGESAVWRVTNSALAACDGFGSDSQLTVQNSSNYVLEEIYATPVDVFDWGANRLGNDVLFPGESATIELSCDVYDVLVVDELGAECLLSNLDLCFDNALWVITNTVLSACDFGVTGESVSKEQRPLPEKHQQEPLSQVEDALSETELL
jgi:hypothetical protein